LKRILMALIIITLMPSVFANSTLNVCQTCNYTTIQSAVDDANNGDTVYILKGTYAETIKINTNINVVGEGKELVFIEPPEGAMHGYAVVNYTNHSQTFYNLSDMVWYGCSIYPTDKDINGTRLRYTGGGYTLTSWEVDPTGEYMAVSDVTAMYMDSFNIQDVNAGISNLKISTRYFRNDVAIFLNNSNVTIKDVDISSACLSIGSRDMEHRQGLKSTVTIEDTTSDNFPCDDRTCSGYSFILDAISTTIKNTKAVRVDISGIVDFDNFTVGYVPLAPIKINGKVKQIEDIQSYVANPILTELDNAVFFYKITGIIENETVTTRFYYTEEMLEGFNESNISLYHFNTTSEKWEPIADTTVDIDQNFIEFITDHYSYFGATAAPTTTPPPPTTSPPPSSGGGGSQSYIGKQPLVIVANDIDFELGTPTILKLRERYKIFRYDANNFTKVEDVIYKTKTVVILGREQALDGMGNISALYYPSMGDTYKFYRNGFPYSKPVYVFGGEDREETAQLFYNGLEVLN